MRKISVSLAALLLFFAMHTASAANMRVEEELTKKEKKARKQELKEWKKRKRKLKPLEYKAMVEAKEALEAQVMEQEEAIKTLKGEVEQLEEMRAKAAKLEAETQKMKKISERLGFMAPFDADDYDINEAGEAFIRGITFRIQIAASKKKEFSKGKGGNVTEDKTGHMYRYTFRTFRNYWEANQVKREVRNVGIKDAFIVAFKDDKEIKLSSKEVQKLIAQQRKRK